MPLEYTEGADHPLQLPYRVEVEWYPYVHGGRRGWSAHLGLSDQHPTQQRKVFILLRITFFMDIFLSHSRKDRHYVDTVKKALGLLDYHPIVYEDLPEEQRPGKDMDNIENLINQSQLIFLFMTNNVISLKHTLTWVQYEDHVASVFKKPVIVFQEQLPDPKTSFPIIYFTDVVPLTGSLADPMKMQEIAKSFRPSGAVIRAVAGAAVGAIFGPIGSLLGALVGLVSTPQNPLQKIPKLECPYCGYEFRYWGNENTSFYCPNCRGQLLYKGWS